METQKKQWYGNSEENWTTEERTFQNRIQKIGNENVQNGKWFDAERRSFFNEMWQQFWLTGKLVEGQEKMNRMQKIENA